MKLLFGSLIFSGFCQKIIMYYYKEDTKNILFSNFIGALISIPLFLIIFLPIYYNLGENFILTIFLMFISIVISSIVSYFIMIKDTLNFEYKTIFLVLFVYLIFGILTYYPLNLDMFIDTEKCIYTIEK